MRRLEINGNIYEAGESYIDRCKELARGAVKPRTIYCVENTEVVMMLQETHPNNFLLNQAIRQYREKGLKVSYKGGQG